MTPSIVKSLPPREQRVDVPGTEAAHAAWQPLSSAGGVAALLSLEYPDRPAAVPTGSGAT